MTESRLKSPTNAANIAMDDKVLVEKFKGGENDAFDRIVEKYQMYVLQFASRLLGWHGDVEDVVQDVFLSVFLGLKSFRGRCSLKTWLVRISINKCRTRQRYRRMAQIGFFWRRGSESNSDQPSSADMKLMDCEKLAQVRRTVRSLPARYREAVILKYLQELSTEEICDVLGISKNVLYVRLSRARQRLELPTTAVSILTVAIPPRLPIVVPTLLSMTPVPPERLA